MQLVLRPGSRLSNFLCTLCLTVACLPLCLASPPLHAQTVAITVDDLPAHSILPPGMTQVDVAKSLLATMQREHLPPIYGFVNGLRTVDAPNTAPVLTLWHGAQEPLGNHTWSHPDLNDLSAEAFLADVDQDNPLLRQLQPGTAPLWFRFPFLHEGDTLSKRRAVRAGLTERGYRIAEVSIDFEDYLWNEPYARCSEQGNTAALQYLHDSYLSTADRYIAIDRALARRAFHRDIRYVLLLHMGAFDAKMLPELVRLLRRRGFHFTTLEHAMRDPAYRLDPDNGDPDGGTLQEMLLEARHESVAPDDKPYDKLDGLCRDPVAPAPPHVP